MKNLITFRQKGDFKNTEKFLNNCKNLNVLSILNTYGQIACDALSAATPKYTGIVANSWEYKIINNGENKLSLVFSNTDVENGFPVAIMIQYGHATKNGGWVEGRDYINPAIQPIFDEISKKISEEVRRL